MLGQQLGGHLGRVHPDLQHRIAVGRVDVCVGEPVGEGVTALPKYREGLKPSADLRGIGRGVQVAGKRHRPGGDRRSGHRIQGVQQCGRGDVGGDLIANRRGQPGLDPARLRRFSDHQHADRQAAHEITFQKSRIAMMLPRSEPLTLDLPPVRGP